MAICVQWDDIDQSVIRMVYDSFWSLDDFLRAFADVQHLMATAPRSYALIFDMRCSHYLPTGSAHYFRSTLAQLLTQHDVAGITFLQADMVVRALMDMLRHQYGLDLPLIRYVETLDAAQMANL